MRRKLCSKNRTFSSGLWSIGDLHNEMTRMGIPIYNDSLGDPVRRGHPPPKWIRELFANTALHVPMSYAYENTKGYLPAREHIAERRNRECGNVLTSEDILFTNGVSEAILLLPRALRHEEMMLFPAPVYPMHALFHEEQGKQTPQYTIDPFLGVDFVQMDEVLRKNKSIVAILLINPDNPTGKVWTKNELETLVEIARTNGVIIVADETYANVVYPNVEYTSVAKVIGDVPAISLRGISKDIPFPGSRCAWMEFYNTGADEWMKQFAKYLVAIKGHDVCATSSTQHTLPSVWNHEWFPAHLEARRVKYSERALIVEDIFQSENKSRATLVKPLGAFYATVVVDRDDFALDPTLRISDIKLRKFAKESLRAMGNVTYSQQLAAYILAQTKILVTPFSSFRPHDNHGFRMTVLEKDKKVLRSNLVRINIALMHLRH